MAHAATHEFELNKNAVVKGQVLVVATSCGVFEGSDPPQSTGLWLSELAEPFYALKEAGYDVTICSPAGGAVPVDGNSLQGDFFVADAKRYQADAEATQQLQATVKLSDVAGDAASFYDAIFLPGGHGPCFDLAASDLLGEVLTKAAAAGKIIASVCHGPVCLVKAKGADGKPLVAGKRVTGFTNSEEEAVGKTKLVPFLLEDKLKELGGLFERSDADWAPHVVTDGLLITGQNPGSAEGVGKALVELLATHHQKGGGVTTTAAAEGLV